MKTYYEGLQSRIEGGFRWSIGGSFASTSDNVHLKDGHVLVADLKNNAGQWNKSEEINLDQKMANQHGFLKYDL